MLRVRLCALLVEDRRKAARASDLGIDFVVLLFGLCSGVRGADLSCVRSGLVVVWWPAALRPERVRLYVHAQCTYLVGAVRRVNKV